MLRVKNSNYILTPSFKVTNDTISLIDLIGSFVKNQDLHWVQT